MDQPPASKPPTGVPNCMQCKHHYITYDPQFPYGCRAFNFKSARQPALDVLEASGQQCQCFLQKEKGKGAI